jgi:hypothetical protein
VSTFEFIDYTVNGTPYSLTPATAYIHHSMDSASTGAKIVGYTQVPGEYVDFLFSNSGIGNGTDQPLIYFQSVHASYNGTITPSATLHITEYGSAGQFISGNFNCTLVSSNPVATYNITCNFRVRRNF